MGVNRGTGPSLGDLSRQGVSLSTGVRHDGLVGAGVTATKYAFRTHLRRRGTGCQRKVARERWRRRTSAVCKSGEVVLRRFGRVAKAYFGGLEGDAVRAPRPRIWYPHGASGRLFRLLRRGRRGESIPLDVTNLNEVDGCAVTETFR